LFFKKILKPITVQNPMKNSQNDKNYRREKMNVLPVGMQTVAPCSVKHHQSGKNDSDKGQKHYYIVQLV
jgi:hypothetical protein